MIECRRYPAPGVGAGGRVLLVMLPGAGISVDDFAARGMVKAVHGLGLAVDIVAARPELELYLDGGVAPALHRLVVAPALAAGYARIWLLGISMGGMGALLYASAHAGLVEGVVLIAPFLGTKGTIAEIAKAGGLAAWRADGSAAVASEIQMLGWLQAVLGGVPVRPALYLGYGRADRFAAGHGMLARAMADDCVVTAQGGHDWDTWLTVWRGLLERRLFQRESGVAN